MFFVKIYDLKNILGVLFKKQYIRLIFTISTKIKSKY